MLDVSDQALSEFGGRLRTVREALTIVTDLDVWDFVREALSVQIEIWRYGRQT